MRCCDLHLITAQTLPNDQSSPGLADGYKLMNFSASAAFHSWAIGRLFHEYGIQSPPSHQYKGISEMVPLSGLEPPTY